jgi:hypothetical protein
MVSKTKFKICKPYKNIKQLCDDLDNGKYIYFGNRPKHYMVISCMTLQTILVAINTKMLRKAESNI